MHTVAPLKENPLNTCEEDSHKKHVDTNSGHKYMLHLFNKYQQQLFSAKTRFVFWFLLLFFLVRPFLKLALCRIISMVNAQYRCLRVVISVVLSYLPGFSERNPIPWNC